MAIPISIDESEIWATRNQRLEALKVRYILTPDDQQQLKGNDLNKIMDRLLYEATEKGEVEKFIDALEEVSKLRKLALWLIFDQVTPSGNSLLHVAASSGNEDVIKLILSHFPYLVTRKNSSEDTPLHVAVQDRRSNATKRLICTGTHSEIIYWKNKDCKSPLYLAAKTGDMEILRLLLEAFARDEAYAVKIQGMSPVLAALEEGKTDILKEIVNRLPMLLHVRGEDGGTPLHSAASVGNAEAVRFLLRECPDLALQTDQNGSYPIHMACEGSSFLTILRLIDMTWPNLAEIKNKNGQNILHVAAKGGNYLPFFFVSEWYGEDVMRKLANSKDSDGNTPLHLASRHNHCEVLVHLARDKRTHLGLLNNDKLTALDEAMKSESLSTKYPALLGCAILITAGVPQSKGLDFRSPTQHTEGTKDQVNTRLLVATLVATVTFAAGFTLPGGYNASSDPRPGTATMLHNRVFQVFVICNMLAMYSSILAVVVLLWGLVSEFYIAEQAYLAAGPLLLMSLASMSVAFMAGVTVAVSKLAWLAFLVLSIAILFLVMLVMVLAALIFPFFKTIAIETVIRIVPLYYVTVARRAQVRRLVNESRRSVWQLAPLF